MDRVGRTPSGEPPAGISTRLAVLLAIASGVAVANIYYAQPLLGQIGRDLGVGRTGLGLVTTVTQAGYFLGLILIVPLGDLVNQRLLIVAGCVIAAAALVSVTNQLLIVEIDPTASSQLIGGNTVYYAIDTGGGAIAATTVYSTRGWCAVCILGAGLSALALLIWAATGFPPFRDEPQRPTSRRESTVTTGPVKV